MDPIRYAITGLLSWLRNTCFESFATYFSASVQLPRWMALYNFSARVRNASSPDDEPMTGPPAANKQNSMQNPVASILLSAVFFVPIM
jgi:hypothetical protein